MHEFPIHTQSMDHIGKFSFGSYLIPRTVFPNMDLLASIYLICTFRRAPTITWKKGGNIIVTGDDFEIDISTFQGRRLDLINVKKDIHEDTYTCEAENSQNRGNPEVFTTKVTVKGM